MSRSDAVDLDRPLPGTRSPRDPERHIPPGTHGLPPEEVQAIQRDRLIDAFVHVVDERGYARAGIEHVCNAAGVSTKAFYRSFADKEDLFTAVYDIGKGAFFSRSASAYMAAGPTWPHRARAAVASILETLADNPALARLCIVEATGVGPVGHDLVTTSIEVRSSRSPRSRPRSTTRRRCPYPSPSSSGCSSAACSATSTSPSWTAGPRRCATTSTCSPTS